MTSNNGYFRFDDTRLNAINGVPLDPTWWSRFYEYAFAMQFIDSNDIVADMGCGWMGRPLTLELARHCKEVYGIDADHRVHGLEKLPNLYYLSMDFTSSEMNYLKTTTFDKIFCISVIEDLAPDNLVAALCNFHRLIKPGGKIIITTDTVWEPFRIAKPYPTVNINHLIGWVEKAGLKFVGSVNVQMPEAPVHQAEWNLACYHCVLERA